MEYTAGNFNSLTFRYHCKIKIKDRNSQKNYYDGLFFIYDLLNDKHCCLLDLRVGNHEIYGL